jgi:hypothetical protein
LNGLAIQRALPFGDHVKQNAILKDSATQGKGPHFSSFSGRVMITPGHDARKRLTIREIRLRGSHAFPAYREVLQNR